MKWKILAGLEQGQLNRVCRARRQVLNPTNDYINLALTLALMKRGGPHDLK
jgi:hypothetical protein